MLLIELLERVADGFDAAVMFVARRRATSAGQPPAAARRRARLMISSRSTSFNWLKLQPRRTRSLFCAANRSTELRRKPTRLRPSNTNRRLTEPCCSPARNRFGRDVELLAQLFDRQNLFAGRVGLARQAASDRSSTNSRKSWLACSPLSLVLANEVGRNR